MVEKKYCMVYTIEQVCAGREVQVYDNDWAPDDRLWYVTKRKKICVSDKDTFKKQLTNRIDISWHVSDMSPTFQTKLSKKMMKAGATYM